MGETTHESSLRRGKAGRFVVLAQFDGAGPDKLLAGLRSRHAAVRVVTDTAQAMVEIAQFKAQVLIVHEPETFCDIESLLSAVRLYHPAVICWRHQGATPEKRENLSPFACQLTPVSPPRFTPAPQSLCEGNGLHRDKPVNGEPSHQKVTQSQQTSFYNVPQSRSEPASTESNQQPASTQQLNGSHQPDPKASPEDGSVHTNGKAKHDRSIMKDSAGRGTSQSAADQSSSQQNSTEHRPTSANNGHTSQGELQNNSPFHVKPFDDDNQSLGHRLAKPLDALDDLTAGPLLSAEEIELLRGPLDDRDYPEEDFFTPPNK